MTTPRLYLFDPNLKNAAGHYLGYAARVSDAAEELGVRSTIVANSQMKSAAASRVLPVLELDYWQEMCPRNGDDPHDHLSRSAERLTETLDRIQENEGWRDSDTLFFPYINLAEVIGLARWRRNAGIAPRTVLLFRRDLDEQGVDAGIGARAGAALLRQALADLYTSEGSDRIRLLTDSDNLTEEHGQALRRRFQTAPIPVDPALFGPRPARFDHTPTLLYLGDARTEKGYLTLPVIARTLRPQLAASRVRMIVQSNFNLPGGEPGIAGAREYLAGLPNVTVLPDPIGEREYNEYLLSADLILLPYQVDRYISRTSGILAEAICSGVPALVPQGTWLADQVRRHGAGVVFDSLAADGPARATLDAVASLDVLRSRAHDRRSAYAHFHRPARLAEFVCGAAARMKAACNE